MAPATREPTAEEKRQSDMKRTGLFKGTIAVIIIYGTILLLMSLIGIFSVGARQTIFSDGFVFSVTFMAGIILVIIMLLIQVFNYKEVKKEIIAGENLVCPEYWELKKTPKDVIDAITDKQAKGMSNYHCQAPVNSGKTPNIVSSTDEGKALNSVASVYNTTTIRNLGATVTCDRLYPEYMAFMDKKTFPDEPTKLRKEYLKSCKDASPSVVIDWPAVSP